MFKSYIANWNFSRIVRLLSGISFIIAAFYMKDKWIGLLGGLFLLQAVTKSGCCGNGGCNIR